MAKNSIAFTASERIMKKYGENAWKKHGPIYEIQAISTGSLLLDYALGKQLGYPEGSIIEVFGWQGAGKTVLGYLAIAAAQKKYPNKPCGIIDAERQFSFQQEWAASLGVNVPELYVSPCITAEEAFDKLCMAIIGTAEYDSDGQITKIVEPGNFSVIMVDSVSQLVPADEIEKEIDASQRQAAQAAAIGKGLRRLVSAMTRVNSKTIIIFINQIRMAPGTLFKNPEYRTGGNSLKFYEAISLHVTKVSKSDKYDTSGKAISHRVQIKPEKLKTTSRSQKAIEFTLRYDGTGIDTDLELFDVGINNGLIASAGAWYFFTDKNGKEDKNFGRFQQAKIKSIFEKYPDKKTEFMEFLKMGKIYANPLTEEELEEIYEEAELKIEEEEKKKKKKNAIISI